jgi:hypothetical protein
MRDESVTSIGERPVKPMKSAPAPAATPQHAPAPAAIREWVSTVLELAGISVLVAGCYLIAPYLGLIVAGLCLILLGAAIGIRR